MKKKEDFLGYSYIYLGVTYILIAVLCCLSIIQGVDTLKADYDTLRNANLSFIKVVTFDIPVVENIIGIFGAFFGFILYLFFGYYFSFALFLILFLIGIFSIASPKNKTPIAKVLLLAGVLFFLNLFLLSVSKFFEQHSGFLINAMVSVLKKIFNSTGAAIISITISIGFLIAIVETEGVKKFFVGIYRLLGRFIRLFKSQSKEKTGKKSRLKGEKSLAISSIDDEKTQIVEDSPTITDHKDTYQKRDVEWGEDFDNIPDDNNLDLPIPPKTIKTTRKPPTIKYEEDTETSDVYRKPDVDMFLQSPPPQLNKNKEAAEQYIMTTSKLLIDKLAQLGIEAEVVNVNIGPIITQFELRLAPNVKVSRFDSVSNDLALAIKAKSIRVQAPIPGKGLVGVEVPNREREIIFLKEVLDSEQMRKNKNPLAIAMGKDIVGNPVVTDLAKMPHLLIAGATGSGKSVCVNSIICNLLFRTEPEELRLVLIDPKRIELSGYEGVPHLIQNIVSDQEEALVVLQWAVDEMEQRYELLQQQNVRDVASYNKKIKSLSRKEEDLETLPLIVIVIDEFADLILKSGRDVEMPITRLAQMARAIGIHLIIATQRPSMKIITGLIKANFPAKIAFRVAQKIDSRVILDMNGAESLLGAGDMLMITPTKALPERIHGTYVSDEEIENLVNYLRSQPKPEQQIEIVSQEEGDSEMVDYDDELFLDAAKLIIATDAASVSMLQRHFKIGYARAGRLINMLEKAKIIGKFAGSKSRDVVATDEVLKLYGLK